MQGALPMNNNNGPVVLVVAPDKSLPQGLSTKDFLGRMPNIGVLYLAAALETNGQRCVVLDRQHSSVSPLQLAVEINTHKPSLVGFTLYDVTMESTRQTLSILRLLYKGAVVVGGYTPTFHAEEILQRWNDVDYVVLREGEKAIVALTEHLNGARTIQNVPNLVYRQDEQIQMNPEDNLVDVNSIPWPKREWPEPGDVTPIVSRRGCLSRCTFCSMVPFYDLRLGPIVRTRNPSNVVDEIAHCVDHGSTEFMFYDDDFGLSSKAEREWCAQFLDCARKRGVKFHWGVELRVTDVIRGESLLRDLCEVGLTHISIGMESLLPRQLKLYGKGYKQVDVFKAVEIARTLPLDFQTNVIFWDPWLTLEEAVEHVELLDQIRIQDQLGSANFPFHSGLLIGRRGTKLHSLLAAAEMLQQRSGNFYEYDYDFVDRRVAAFHKGAFFKFLARAHAVVRPAALWLFVPRIEHAGQLEIASAYRRYARTIAHAEFEYFRALVTAACHNVDPVESERLADRIHAEFGPQIDSCADLLPVLSSRHAAVAVN
jgi:anaerobic magnesium-protoporphyrin IX monomethyl ester cyclase